MLDKALEQKLGTLEIKQGMRIKKEEICHLGTDKVSGKDVYYFAVNNDLYNFNRCYIVINNNELSSFHCECSNFYTRGTCKHVAACIIHYKNQMFNTVRDNLILSTNILKEFVSNQEITGIKQALNLDLEISFEKENPSYKLMIGLDKMYLLSDEYKFSNFIKAFELEQEYEFGVNLTYNPNKHFFNNQDIEILEYLKGYKKTNSYYNRDNFFELSDRELKTLFKLLEGKPFKIKGHGQINQICYEMPTEITLELKENIYTLKIEDFNNYVSLDKDSKYILYKDVLYVIDNKYSKFIQKMYNNDLNKLEFKKEDIKIFKEGLLPRIKENIKIDKKITDIIISKEPIASLYFDLTKDKVLCEIKLDYNGKIVKYFDENSPVLRDKEYENNIINELFKLDFNMDKNKIYLDDLEKIVNFLKEGLSLLSKKYKIFTTKKFDNTNIIKKTTFNSNFSIGKDGIMRYEFNTDNINLEELTKVLTSLKNNQKYYRLKNGDIVDLTNNESLNEINSIISDLEISNLKEGSIEIPKYRAFYIDSLKQNKYTSINTDNSFDTFISNFKKYKKVDIKFDKCDEEILRGYQKEGVKWLYTLYKCDLGGILADEMGLGKSLQTICFIKQILKEKKDAKIMIVCPTSLVYNWKKEFDKFAPNLKYITVADSKQKRKEIINNFNDYNIFITSYGLIRNDNDEYEDKEFELCVIDEAQAIKNHQASLTKEIKKIKARTKIALTGTPLENSVLELWSIFDFIMPGYLNSILKFKQKYGIKEVDENSLEKLTNLNYQIKPFILRRKKKDVTKDLPDKIENNIYLELPDMQKALYLKVLKEKKEEFEKLVATEGFGKARFKILQLLMKLRQICVDPNIIYSNYTGESVKTEKLIEVVKNYVNDGHKILIFSTFKTVIDRLKETFDKENISSYIISGEVNGKTRTELVDKFNNDDTNCFLITIKAGGTGLNLTSADVVIHLDIWWNPQVENQATDRAHRIGQKNKVTVIKFITKGTIEERILELQNKKQILSDNLIEGNETEAISSLSEDEIKDLFAYGED